MAPPEPKRSSIAASVAMSWGHCGVPWLYRRTAEYAALGHDGQPAGLFAAKLRSDPGQHNGLYWPVGEGEPASPAGEEVVRAAAEGYRAVVGQRTPIMATTTVSCMLRAAANGGRKSTLSKGS